MWSVNTKAGQGDLLTVVPVAGRLPRTTGQSQMAQFIAVCNALTPTGLSGSADGPLKRTEEVPKRESEVDVWGLAPSPLRRNVSPFVTGKAHMKRDQAGDQFVVGMEVTTS